MIIIKPQNILRYNYFNTDLYISNSYIYINNNNGENYISEIPYKMIFNIISQIFKGNITERYEMGTF